jgi:hypothetical protein
VDVPEVPQRRIVPAHLIELDNLDPKNRQECTYEVPLHLLGLPDDAAVEVEDLLLGYKFELYGKAVFRRI